MYTVDGLDCFVIGIIKGLVEHKDPTRHFGSTLSFNEHVKTARDKGLVDEDGQLTEAGLRFYEKHNLAKLPDCRAYMW